MADQSGVGSEQDKLDFRAHYIQYNDEQEEVQSYVRHKYMQRPKTNLFTILMIVLAYLLACGFGTWLLTLFDIPLMLRIVLSVFLWMFVFWAISRRFLIKVVECYQHYAKESTRRKCLCMPTCSEYAIAVLEKHFLIVALYKIWKRLFKTCKNGVYKKDYP